VVEISRQELDTKSIDEILNKVKLGYLGTVNDKGNPYIVPLAYRYLDGAIYLHIAETGEKMDNIRNNPNVCFSVTSLNPTSSMLRAEKWSDFASVIIRGKAEKVINEPEKIKVYGDSGWGVVYKIKPETMTGRSWSYK